MTSVLPAIVLLAVTLGCQSDPRAQSASDDEPSAMPPGAKPNRGGAGGEGPESSVAGQGGDELGAGAAGTAGEANSAQPFGTHEVVTVAVDGCSTPPDSSESLVLPASLGNAVYDRMGSVGQRRFAFSRNSQTLFTFDSAGQLSTTLGQVAGAASNGTELIVVFADETQAVLQRYDDTLAARGESVALASSAARNSAVVAANDSQALVVWLETDHLAVNLWSESGVDGLDVPFDEAPEHCRLQAVSATPNFALLSACSGPTNSVSWFLISGDAKLLAQTTILEPTAELELVTFSWVDPGYAFLLHDVQQRTAYIANIDPDGRLDGAIRAFSGLSLAFDLAPWATGLSTTAQLASGVTAMGRLDASGDDHWTCLDQSSPGSCAALQGLGKSNSALVRHANGSAWLMDIP